MALGKHLGTQQNQIGRYDYYAEDKAVPLHVFQVKIDNLGATSSPVWMCSFAAWERTMHKVCNA